MNPIVLVATIIVAILCEQTYAFSLSGVASQRRLLPTRLFAASPTDTQQHRYAYLEKVRAAMDESGNSDVWEASVDLLREVVGTTEVAEDCLAKAWNWRRWAVVTSPMARKFIKTTDPDTKVVEAALDWLQTGPLALDTDVLREAIVGCPENYLINPEKSYQQALRVAPEQWRDASAFRELLVTEDPTLIMRTYNCADDGCNSECGNCWVSRR